VQINFQFGDKAKERSLSWNAVAASAAGVSAIATILTATVAINSLQTNARGKLLELQITNCLDLQNVSEDLNRQAADIILFVEAHDREQGSFEQAFAYRARAKQYYATARQLIFQRNKLDLLSHGRTVKASKALILDAFAYPVSAADTGPNLFPTPEAKTIGKRYGALDKQLENIRQECIDEVGRFAGRW
jgi:hypothetical protein